MAKQCASRAHQDALIAELSEGMIRSGTVPAIARMVAILTFADDAGMSQADLCSALGLSTGTVSTGLRQLLGLRMIERVPTLTERAARYRMPIDGPLRTLEATMVQIEEQGELLRHAVESLDDKQSRPETVLRAMLLINERHAAATRALIEELQ